MQCCRGSHTLEVSAKEDIMLVLTRKLSQSIMVGEIEVTVVEVHDDSIRLGIQAPRGVVVDRKEIWLEKQQSEKQQSEKQRKGA